MPIRIGVSFSEFMVSSNEYKKVDKMQELWLVLISPFMKCRLRSAYNIANASFSFIKSTSPF